MNVDVQIPRLRSLRGVLQGSPATGRKMEEVVGLEPVAAIHFRGT
jgi:hypothetical protein